MNEEGSAGVRAAVNPFVKEIEVEVKTLPHFEGLSLPEYQTHGASGFDLCASCEVPISLAPGARTLVPTGLQVALPHGFELQIRPRSGLAVKHGLTLLNTPGTIDSDYRGEIKLIVINLGSELFMIERGMRMAQAVLAEALKAKLVQADNLSATNRAQGGFGHTGI